MGLHDESGMHLADLSKTTADILFERMHAYEIDCADTGAKDIGLIVEALDYIYTTHDCRDELLPNGELASIVSRAYDADRTVKEILDEARGIPFQDDGDDRPPEEADAYTSLVSGLSGYFWSRAIDDDSERVSTPQRAEEYVAAMRSVSTKFTREFLDEISSLDEDVFGNEGVPDEVRKTMVDGMLELAAQTDASIIADAAVPYKDTDYGKNTFAGLRPYVDDLLKYHGEP